MDGRIRLGSSLFCCINADWLENIAKWRGDFALIFLFRLGNSLGIRLIRSRAPL